VEPFPSAAFEAAAALDHVRTFLYGSGFQSGLFQGLTPSETALFILSLKQSLFAMLRSELGKQPETLIKHLRISVNVSSRQLKHPVFFELVEQILQETQLPPQFLELEITESLLMENNQSNIAVLQALKNKGIYISVDDFGTGFSSLSYIKHFPVDALKIDQIFVKGIPQDQHDAAIASAIIGMAHSLELGVVAEGIEYRAQSDYLQLLGCDSGQGYLFSKPISAGALTAKFMKGEWA
jgi:EAL domain-containing protein (putative c-di-GMP-specific phosphodiesterase class I)